MFSSDITYDLIVLQDPIDANDRLLLVSHSSVQRIADFVRNEDECIYLR